MGAMEENIQKPGENKGSRMPWRDGAMKKWVEKQAGRPLKTSDKVIGTIFLIIFLFVFYVVLDANKYSMMVQVIEGQGKVGVNPTSEALDFGDMSLGTQATRRVDLKNGTFMPVYVMIFKMGNLSELVKVTNENNEEDSFFKLGAGREVKIDFTASIPASAKVGSKYSGRVFLFKVPTFGL